jgi:cytochrome c oxidase assembly protein subunit 11
MQNDDLQRRNQRVMVFALIFVVGMVALSFAAVPLYRLFCQVTGLGGTTQTGRAAPQAIPQNTRPITVRFDTAVDARLPWRFTPEVPHLTLQIGQVGFASYAIENTSNHTTSGVAVYNVTPPKAGKYFVKTQCFCFAEQTLKAGEKSNNPVVFFVDPEMLKDPNLRDVQEITLSYRYYPAGSEALEKAMEAVQNAPQGNSQKP